MVLLLSSNADRKLILEVIDNGLDTLGKSPKQAIWILLEKDFTVTRKEISENLAMFTDALQKIFGLGYRFLDTLFCHYLQEATGRNFPKNQSFCECIELLYPPS